MLVKFIHFAVHSTVGHCHKPAVACFLKEFQCITTHVILHSRFRRDSSNIDATRFHVVLSI